MIVIDGLLAFLISSALDTNPLKILVCGVLFIWLLSFLSSNDWKLKLSNEAIALFLVLFVALVNSAFFLTFVDFDVAVDMNKQMLGLRKFAIEAVFGVFLYLYLKTKSYHFVLNLIYIGALANCIVALIQLPIVFTSSYRASMLFFEPSSAGFYYCFSVFLLFMGAGSSPAKKGIAISFSILGLIAFSKAQFLVLAIVAILASNVKVKIAGALCLAVVFGVFTEQIQEIYYSLVDSNLQLYGIDRMVSAVGEMGVLGLSNEYEVTDTYVTRLSGIYVAFMTLFDYPLGIGAATFNPVYKQYLIDNDLVNVFDGTELDLLFRGEAWASPRSRILEIVVSAGVVALASLVYIFRSFFLARHANRLLFTAFLSTFIAGVVLELNPIIDYFVVLIVLLEKLRSGDMREEHEKL